MVNRLLGSYPSLNLHDPEVYIANLVTLLLDYPRWAGEKAIIKVKRETKFLPTEAELYPALEDQVAVHRRARAWEQNASAMLDERKLLAGPVVPRLTYDELKAKYGENWGITNPDKTNVPQWWKTRGELRQEFGEAFDALPDAPITFKDFKSACEPLVNNATTKRSPEPPLADLEGF